MGLLLAAQSNELDFRGFDADEQARKALMLFYGSFGTTPQRTVYVPPTYREVIEKIYTTGNLPRTVHSEFERSPQTAAQSTLRLNLRHETGVAFVVVDAYGEDFLSVLQQQVRQLQINRYELILVVLPWGTGHQLHYGSGRCRRWAVVRRYLSGVRGRDARTAEPGTTWTSSPMRSKSPRTSARTCATSCCATTSRPPTAPPSATVPARTWPESTKRSSDRTGRLPLPVLPLALTYLAVALNMTIASVALPTISTVPGQCRTTGVDRQRHPMVSAAFILFAGAWSDRIGRKRMLIIGNVIFLVSAILSGMTDSVQTLILLRALTGLGSAMAMPAAMALTFDVTRHEPARRNGHYGWTQAIGALLGPLLGGARWSPSAGTPPSGRSPRCSPWRWCSTSSCCPATNRCRGGLDSVGSALTAVSGVAFLYAAVSAASSRTRGSGWPWRSAFSVPWLLCGGNGAWTTPCSCRRSCGGGRSWCPRWWFSWSSSPSAGCCSSTHAVCAVGARVLRP